MFTEISGILILSGHSSWLETENTIMSQGEKIKARRLSRPNIHLKAMRSLSLNMLREGVKKMFFWGGISFPNVSGWGG